MFNRFRYLEANSIMSGLSLPQQPTVQLSQPVKIPVPTRSLFSKVSGVINMAFYLFGFMFTRLLTVQIWPGGVIQFDTPVLVFGNCQLGKFNSIRLGFGMLHIHCPSSGLCFEMLCHLIAQSIGNIYSQERISITLPAA